MDAISFCNYSWGFYGDTLFTSDGYLKKNPDIVERFRRASLKGWKYAMAHQEECADQSTPDAVCARAPPLIPPVSAASAQQIMSFTSAPPIK